MVVVELTILMGPASSVKVCSSGVFVTSGGSSFNGSMVKVMSSAFILDRPPSSVTSTCGVEKGGGDRERWGWGGGRVRWERRFGRWGGE